MFIKPYRIKSNILVPGSERKKLRQRVMTQFGRADDESTASPLAELFGNRMKVCTVKIITYHDEPVTVYTSDKRPIFFEVSGRLVPTVYTLWSCPDLVPAFTTQPTVLPKLANGADLMIPGIVKQGTGPASWGRHRKDDIVAVNLTSNRAAVGVGLLAHSSDDLYMCGGRGVCVKMLHVFGDKLWGMEPSVCQQVPLQGSVVSVPTESDFPPLGSEKPKPVEAPIKQVTKALQSANLNVDNGTENDGDGSSSEEESEDPAEEEETPPNPDDQIKSAFLNALKLHGKKIQLPLLTSTFYPQYVQPEIPEGVEMKKTSYKKVGTFFKRMAEEGLIEIKEEKKGIEKVTSVNLEHPDVLSFYPYKITKGAEQDAAAGVSSGGPASNPLLLTKMTAMYAVNERTSKLFGCFNVAVGQTLEPTQVRNHLRDYVGRNKLIDLTTKLIGLDETLREICGHNELVYLADLSETVLNCMTSTFEMRSQRGPVMKGGKRAIIHLTTATRSGNKKVTLISNLEDYGINVSEFAKAVKLGAAASTTMTEVPGVKGEQLLVQGNHIKFVFDLLTTTYQVPKACITGLEFAKEQKKKKKK
uniref:Uncharacterized protein n=1 Tax=Anopheles atroparvus TaxID=41427 RepID=A0A182ITF1_ANOAO